MCDHWERKALAGLVRRLEARLKLVEAKIDLLLVEAVAWREARLEEIKNIEDK